MFKKRIALSLLSLVAVGCDPAEDVSSPAAGPVPLVAKEVVAQSCPLSYFGYMPYPMQVCELPDPFPGGPIIKTKSIPEVPRSSTSVTPQESPLKGLCTIKHGPWSADLIERPSCDQKGVSDFELVIAGPQKVTFYWSGTLEQAPPPINPGVFSIPKLLPCICCPGFRQCPDGGCVNIHLPCPNPRL